MRKHDAVWNPRVYSGSINALAVVDQKYTERSKMRRKNLAKVWAFACREEKFRLTTSDTKGDKIL
jgi:hypothetical protein